MNKKIVCENDKSGSKIEFSYSYPFFLVSYDGIHEISADVSTIKSAFGIGVSYVGTSINKRNISIVCAFKDDGHLQNKRDLLYNTFQLKQSGTLYYYENEIKRKIQYYVEDISISKKAPIYQVIINLICPSPYFTDFVSTIIKIKNWESLFEWELEIPEGGMEFGSRNEETTALINNPSNINLGMQITFSCIGQVINPMITNSNTQELLKVNKTINTGEKIIITTYLNNKNIIFVDKNGNRANINNLLVFGTKFLQAKNGENKFVPNADQGIDFLQTEISYMNNYEAI